MRGPKEMERIKITVGRSDFTDIRRKGCYFVDKTGLIEELLQEEGTQVTLITRPRRFGKSLAMSMLAAFFDIRRDSRGLFRGLRITENPNLCNNWMNRCPVLSISFRNVGGNTFSSAYGMLKSEIADLCNEHYYLKDSPQVNENDRNVFLVLADSAAGKPTEEQVKKSLFLLTRMMSAHYGKPVVLLIDEYDVPLAKASGAYGEKEDYYEQMLDIVGPLVGTALKDNPYLHFAVVAGCLRIAKESIFTGTNNFVSDTISDTRFNEYFGFTQAEVDQLLTDTGLEGHREDMKAWYNGYHFGDCAIYCPWDVMNYVSDLQRNPAALPDSYWKNSSDNAIIRTFLDYAGESITKKFEALLAGNYIVQKVREDLTYDYLHSSEENLWSILYLTGYLTCAELPKEETGKIDRGCLPLAIPNEEVREIFESTIKVWFEDCSRQSNRRELFAAVWRGDAKRAEEEISKLLRRTISYNDYKEDFYHAFLAGIFAGAGYVVESNREHGEGRSDVAVLDYAGDCAAVFELKYSRSQNDLKKDCEAALRQIEEKGYAEDFHEECAKVICYGIAFYKKRCKVLRLQ